MRAGVEERVRLATPPETRAWKAVARAEPRAPAQRRPPSKPVAFSAPRASLARVSTLPTRNARYSSLSVGARKERWAAARRESPPRRSREADTRGLSARSL